MERLLELAKSENIKVDISTLKHFEIKPTESSYWMTITSMSIPDSIGLTREVQKDALKEESFPRLIECLVLCILNRKTNPNVEYIRCEEVVDGDSVFVKANDQGILVIKLTIPMGTRAAHRF
ncbi:MAG: hypothetical protein LVR00_08175 [Rhabdochlamydiaceae bacterium]